MTLIWRRSCRYLSWHQWCNKPEQKDAEFRLRVNRRPKWPKEESVVWMTDLLLYRPSLLLLSWLRFLFRFSAVSAHSELAFARVFGCVWLKGGHGRSHPQCGISVVYQAVAEGWTINTRVHRSVLLPKEFMFSSVGCSGEALAMIPKTTPTLTPHQPADIDGQVWISSVHVMLIES